MCDFPTPAHWPSVKFRLVEPDTVNNAVILKLPRTTMARGVLRLDQAADLEYELHLAVLRMKQINKRRTKHEWTYGAATDNALAEADAPKDA